MPTFVHHWRKCTDSPEPSDVDGKWHFQITGVFAPSTGCGIPRGDGRVWEEQPPFEDRCEDCQAAQTEILNPTPPEE